MHVAVAKKIPCPALTEGSKLHWIGMACNPDKRLYVTFPISLPRVVEGYNDIWHNINDILRTLGRKIVRMAKKVIERKGKEEAPKGGRVKKPYAPDKQQAVASVRERDEVYTLHDLHSATFVETKPARSRLAWRLSYGNSRKSFEGNAKDDNQVYAMIRVVRKGISPKEFEHVQKSTSFSTLQWARLLQLSERTLQRYRDENKVFQPVQSERILDIALLYDYGIDVFEDKDNFEAWLNSKIPALGNQQPIDLLDTQFGIQLVKDQLTRIAHGIFA
jgi:putative toxin-antitoxin system antitoxin component (TIGR02293 family)